MSPVMAQIRLLRPAILETRAATGGGEAVIRFQPGPIFTGSPADYWAPLNWLILDNNDKDLGSSGPLLVDVPGATPSALVVASGKDGNGYLLDRDYFGGISDPVASSHLSDFSITQAAATYQTNQGTYVALRASRSMLSAFRISATNPPAIVSGWSVSCNGAARLSSRRPMARITQSCGWSAPKAINGYMVTMATLAMLFTLVAARTN